MDALDRMRTICLDLPQTYEEPAWIGTRWCVRKKNFAHLVQVGDGWTPVFQKWFDSAEPRTVVTYRLPYEEIEALCATSDSHVRLPWAPNLVGTVLDTGTDWVELAESITESYRIQAPAKLVRLLGESVTD